VPFQILRQPIRSAVDPLQLPEGIVIDLAYSGMSTQFSGPLGFGFDTSTVNPVISFAPSGSVDMLYDGPNYPGGHPTGNLFLLLGRREQAFTAGYTPPPPLYASNVLDPNSLWVSIGYQTGQVLTAENYANNGGNIASARSLATGNSSVTGSTTVTTMGGN
jgi:hypothetical protein